MIDLIIFFYTAYRAYRLARHSGHAYAASTSHGVPQIACFVATGRDAWRVSQRAVEEFVPKR